MGDEPKCIIHKRMISFYFHKEIEQMNYVAVFWLIGKTDPGEFKKRKKRTHGVFGNKPYAFSTN